MKVMQYLVPLISLFGCAFSTAENWVVKLDQRHLESSGSMMVEVDPVGTGMSALAIPEGGSEFTLWAIGQDAQGLPQWYEIDSQVVGAYMPTGELSISTEDPVVVNGVHRTRIDRPFSVTYTVGGLKPAAADAPEAAKKVLLDHNIAYYAEGYVSPNNLGSETDFLQSDITTNGVGTLSFPITNMTLADGALNAGREVFRLYALPDGVYAQNQLSEAKIDVWPIVSASFSGIEELTYSQLPEFSVLVSDIYPESHVYVVCYKGDDRTAAISEGTYYEFNTQGQRYNSDPIPIDAVLPIDELAKGVTEAGNWTVEVLSDSIFGIESLRTLKFNYTSSIKVRGSINSLGD